MRHFFVDFLTNTMLANQVGYFVSIMNLTLDNLATSSSIANILSSPTFHLFYFGVYPRYVWGRGEQIEVSNEIVDLIAFFFYGKRGAYFRHLMGWGAYPDFLQVLCGHESLVVHT